MVRNKEELVEAANAWLEVAQNDIRKHAIAFMESTNIDTETLADILDVDVEVVEDMVDGVCDIPMSVFAKILIATNHAIMIAPVEALAKGGFGNGAPRMPMREEVRRQPRQRTTTETRPSQPRDRFGRFTSTATNHDTPTNERAPRRPNGFPMPNPNGQLPSPEEFMQQFENPFSMPNGEPIPRREVTRANRDVETSEEDALAVKLARALRANPEMVNLLRSLTDED